MRKARLIADALSPPAVLLRLLRSVKSEIRDTFVAFERLVGLIGRYTTLLAPAVASTRSGNYDGEEDAKVGGMEEDKERACDALCILGDLARLAEAAVAGCEANKVSFVRAGKQKKSTNGTDADASSNSNSSSNGRDGSGGISAVVAALRQLLQLNKGGGDNDESGRNIIPTAMAAYCRLLAALCRFDDFRSPSASGMAATDVAVSSAHDHVLEFHRQGIVPILHEVTALALLGEKDNENENEDEDENGRRELASAALAATRTLAVNDEIVQALVAGGVLRSARAALAAGARQAPARRRRAVGGANKLRRLRRFRQRRGSVV